MKVNGDEGRSCSKYNLHYNVRQNIRTTCAQSSTFSQVIQQKCKLLQIFFHSVEYTILDILLQFSEEMREMMTQC